VSFTSSSSPTVDTVSASTSQGAQSSAQRPSSAQPRRFAPASFGGVRQTPTAPTATPTLTPAPTGPDAATFEALGVNSRFIQALERQGITAPTPIQARAIPPLLAGRDVIGQSRTGSGKTIAFGLPLLERIDLRQRQTQALILTPTRELATQIADVLQSVAGPGLRIAQLIGGRAMGPQREALAAGAQIAVGAPGRVYDLLGQGALHLDALRVVVLDEADEMLDVGFAPTVERILAKTPDHRQMALFTATLPTWVTKLAARFSHDPLIVSVIPPTTARPMSVAGNGRGARPGTANANTSANGGPADGVGEAPNTITQTVYMTQEGGRFDALLTLLNRPREQGETTLIFARTKHGARKLAKLLEARGYPVAALQGNMSQNARDRVVAAFRTGETPILVATNVAARGLDVTTITMVINYELPESAALFNHRIGRTGRMDRPGEAITLLAPEDAPTWRRMQMDLGVSLPPIPWPGAQNGAQSTPNGAAYPRVTPPAAPTTAPTQPASAQPTFARPTPRHTPQPARHAPAVIPTTLASRPAGFTGGGSRRRGSRGGWRPQEPRD